jgi:hypothetical protein
MEDAVAGARPRPLRPRPAAPKASSITSLQRRARVALRGSYVIAFLCSKQRSTPREMKYFSCAGLELGSKNYLWPLCFMLRGVHFIHFSLSFRRSLSLCERAARASFSDKTLSASAKCGCPHQSPPTAACRCMVAKNTSYQAKTHWPANQSAARCSFCVSHSSYRTRHQHYLFSPFCRILVCLFFQPWPALCLRDDKYAL